MSKRTSNPDSIVIECVEKALGLTFKQNERELLGEALQDAGLIAPNVVTEAIDLLVEKHNDDALRLLSAAMEGSELPPQPEWMEDS